MRESLSFVRRGARMTSAQEAAWQKYSSLYLVSVARDAHDTSIKKSERRTPEELFDRQAPLVVEIGIGKGEAVVHAASLNPDKDFLGIEVFRAGLAKTMLEAAEAGLKNLRVIEANAPEVLAFLLPEDSVDEIRIFFPDPWHKKKHTKRRLIVPPFLDTLMRVLKPGGIVRLATDWQHYADQMLSVFDEHPGFVRDFDGDWAERFAERPITSFERKGQRAGRVIRDLTFKKIEH